MRTTFRRTQPKHLRSLRPTGFHLTAALSQRRAEGVEALPVVMVTEPQQELRSRANEFHEPSRIESPRRDTLQLYLREIGQVKLLTPEEEITLARRIRGGDKLAREEMIKANLRLVVKIAHDYEDLGLPLLDLINEGNIGLMKGVERFDPRKGAKLSTYASWWIKQSMKRALANQSRTIRLPVHAVDKVASIRRAEMRLHEILEREPTDEEVANEVGISDARRVRHYREASRRPVELDAPIGTESNSEPGSDVVADPNASAPFDRLVKENDRALIQ
jgi:RNA polymerase primary sigma factor